MDNDPPKRPGQKTLHVWAKPIDADTQAKASQDGSEAAPAGPPSVMDAMATIKLKDFVNVFGTPCAQGGYLTGIASGAGVGVLKFALHGNPKKAANWAVATFVLGCTVSYEVCQYKRRAERAQMKRSIEIVAEDLREKARIAAEESREEAERLRKQQQKPWYKFW